jgi:hypothetical protein
MYEVSVMDDKSVELYHVLNYCKEGNCAGCKRDPKDSNTYWCRKQLLQDCFNWFDKYLEKE